MKTRIIVLVTLLASLTAVSAQAAQEISVKRAEHLHAFADKTFDGTFYNLADASAKVNGMAEALHADKYAFTEMNYDGNHWQITAHFYKKDAKKIKAKHLIKKCHGVYVYPTRWANRYQSYKTVTFTTYEPNDFNLLSDAAKVAKQHHAYAFYLQDHHYINDNDEGNQRVTISLYKKEAKQITSDTTEHNQNNVVTLADGSKIMNMTHKHMTKKPFEQLHFTQYFAISQDMDYAVARKAVDEGATAYKITSVKPVNNYSGNYRVDVKLYK